jgi:hypothetical protein
MKPSIWNGTPSRTQLVRLWTLKNSSRKFNSNCKPTEQFGTGSGRSVELNTAKTSLILTYAAKDGDVPAVQLTDSTNDGAFVLNTPEVTREAIIQTQEMFDNNGRFLRSGNLVIEHIDTDNTAASFGNQSHFRHTRQQEREPDRHV